MNDCESQVRVLAVSPRESDASALAHILGHSAWTLFTTTDVRSARRVLSENQIHVLLSDLEMSDGTWKDLLAEITDVSDPPSLIVTALHADDRLWAEVLNLGAWDVLVKPYNPKEVFRTIHLAWQHCTNQRRLPRRENASETAHPPAVAAGTR